MNAFLLLLGGSGRRLNVTRYSNAAYILFSIYSRFFFSGCLSLSLSLCRSQSLTDG